MKNSKNSKLCFVVGLAAVVAAATTLAVLLMRARAKKRALSQYNDPIECGFDDDCCCGCDDACGCVEEEPADAAEETVRAEETPDAE